MNWSIKIQKNFTYRSWKFIRTTYNLPVSSS